MLEFIPLALAEQSAEPIGAAQIRSLQAETAARSAQSLSSVQSQPIKAAIAPPEVSVEASPATALPLTALPSTREISSDKSPTVARSTMSANSAKVTDESSRVEKSSSTSEKKQPVVASSAALQSGDRAVSNPRSSQSVTTLENDSKTGSNTKKLSTEKTATARILEQSSKVSSPQNRTDLQNTSASVSQHISSGSSAVPAPIAQSQPIVIETESADQSLEIRKQERQKWLEDRLAEIVASDRAQQTQPQSAQSQPVASTTPTRSQSVQVAVNPLPDSLPIELPNESPNSLVNPSLGAYQPLPSQPPVMPPSIAPTLKPVAPKPNSQAVIQTTKPKTSQSVPQSIKQSVPQSIKQSVPHSVPQSVQAQLDERSAAIAARRLELEARQNQAIKERRSQAQTQFSGNSSNLAYVNPRPSVNPEGEIIYPLPMPVPVTSNYGWRTHPITGAQRFHSGTDMGAPEGMPVLAALGGRVAEAEYMGGYGLTIVIEHDNGVRDTLYAHLSNSYVRAGDVVQPGQAIGEVGTTGASTGPHLHFEARQMGAKGLATFDPGPLLEQAMATLVKFQKAAQVDRPPVQNTSAQPNSQRDQSVS